MNEKVKIIVRNNILSNQVLDYMLDILNSELTEKDKAEKLYAICNCSNLNNNILYRRIKNSESREVEKLTILEKFYDSSKSKGYFEPLKKSYKCSLEEMEIRLEKINEALNIINTNESDYEKAYKLYSLYKSAAEFKRSYTYFIKYGSEDTRLDFAREALNNFNAIYDKYLEYENNGIMKDIKHFSKVNDYLINYNYAKFVIEYYINSSDSYKENKFLSELGIDKQVFEFCIKTIEELDIELYKKYLEKKETNNKIRFIKNKRTIEDLAVAIKTGTLPNGSTFDILEFIQRVPFKYSKDFCNVIADFMKSSNMSEFAVIMNYIYNNKLHLSSTFKPLNLDEVYNTKMIVGGREVTKKDIDNIIEYLNLRNIPVINKTFSFARNKYLNGEINVEQIREDCSSQVKQVKVKERILIPTINK